MLSIGLHEDTARSLPTYRTSVPRSRGHGDQCAAAAVGRVVSLLSSDTNVQWGGVPYRSSTCLTPLVDIAPTFTIAPQCSSTQRGCWRHCRSHGSPTECGTGTVSTCDSGRVGVGAPSVRRHWLRAYVLRLEERMDIVGRHVTHRLERLEELVVACACTAAMRRGSADCQRCGPTRSLGQCAESDPSRSRRLTEKHEHRRVPHMRSIGLNEDTVRSPPTYRTSVRRSRGHGDQCAAAAVGRVVSLLSSDTNVQWGGVPYR